MPGIVWRAAPPIAESRRPRKFVADRDDAAAIRERIGHLLHRAVPE
jgi:hypothetical protein